MGDFSRYLKHKYLDYVNQTFQETERVPSRSDFARWLGVTNVAFLTWIQGKRLPREVHIEQLVAKLGPEVYQALGVEPPTPIELVVLARNWYQLTPEQRQQLASMASPFMEKAEASEPEPIPG